MNLKSVHPKRNKGASTLRSVFVLMPFFNGHTAITERMVTNEKRKIN